MSSAAAPRPADVDAVAAAERWMGVRYTAAEREQMVATLDAHLTVLRALRATPLGLDDAPALRFDPRLRPIEGRPLAPGPLRLDAQLPKLPSTSAGIAFAPLPHLHHFLRSKQLSSRELTELYLARLERYGPGLACVVTLTPELALAQADRADQAIARGQLLGPLHGIPWAAKDLLDTQGIRTTFGAEFSRDRVPDRDAHVVRKLEVAGAVLAAKVSLGALAYGDLWFGGQTRNPWNPVEGASGSSAGSAAAVAAGLVGFAIGSETLGSIVSPAMRCGVTGLRPTFGRVGRSGAMPLAWSLDKLGPLARGVEDCAAVLAAIEGPDPRDPSSIDLRPAIDLRGAQRDGLRGRRVVFDPRWFEGAGATQVERDVLDRLREAGAQLVERSLAELPYEALLTGLLAEVAAAWEPITLDGRDDTLGWQADEAWPNTLRAARFLSAVELVQSDRLRRKAMHALDEFLLGADLAVGPSFSGPMLTATNFTGHPCLVLRCGFETVAPRGLLGAADAPAGPPREVPRGISLWAKPFDEATLLRAGVALESGLRVADRRPAGFET